MIISLRRGGRGHKKLAVRVVTGYPRMAMTEPVWNDVAVARERIAPFIHVTPIMTSASIDRRCATRVVFKCENFQRSGSFKFRGAVNAIAALSPDERTRGVVTHSSGNHGQALALAAHEFAIAAHIVIPEDALQVKLAAARAYGAQVVTCAPTAAARADKAAQIIRKTGAVFVDSHDDPLVIAGQGTAAVELVEEAGPLDAVVVPIGGGGLIAGTAIAVHHLSPTTRVIGVEPAGADDAYRGMRTGTRITDFTPHTIADGLRTPLGELNFAIIRNAVDDIIRADDDDIIAALRLIWTRMKIVVEPSSAIALVPLLTGAVRGGRIGIILTGGNVDLGPLFARGTQ